VIQFFQQLAVLEKRHFLVLNVLKT
jgi:hypothetical protein